MKIRVRPYDPIQMKRHPSLRKLSLIKAAVRLDVPIINFS
jgi:hypothetical protein